VLCPNVQIFDELFKPEIVIILPYLNSLARQTTIPSEHLTAKEVMLRVIHLDSGGRWIAAIALSTLQSVAERWNVIGRVMKISRCA
jgi:hypothetical protein